MVNGWNESVHWCLDVPCLKALLQAVVTDRELGGPNAGGFTGAIDALWVYNRQLCAAELKLLMEAQTYALKVGGESGATVAVERRGAGTMSLGIVATYYKDDIKAGFLLNLAVHIN